MITIENGDKVDGKSAVQSWYNEIDIYRPFFGREPNMDSFMKFGHFSQLLWQSTTQMGTGCASSPGYGTVIVSNYNPAGNYEGQFGKNVVPPIE